MVKQIKGELFKRTMLLLKRFGSWGRKIGMSMEYYRVRHRWPNFKNPQDLSERILASMQKKEFLDYSILADKVAVHDYIRRKGLESILLKHYAVWESVDDVKIDSLPNKFVLKPNNGSGGHFYCRDKSSFDLESTKEQLKENLLRGEDYFYEPHYLCIKPKVFAEEFLDLGEGKVLTDYKFTCIKGKIVDVFLAGENDKGERKYATVDLNWNILPYTKKEYLLAPLPAKPNCLDEMIKYAHILSADFDFVRVDFYEFENKVYFSELTFSPWGGYMYSYTDEALIKLGNYFNN